MGNLQKSQNKAAEDAQSNNSPSGNLDLLVGDTLAHVPHQVTQAVEAVVGEGEADDELSQDGKSGRPRSKGSGKTGALKVPAKGRSDQV